ncbi:hypothetical protein FACS1894211_04780 [Clostridia bacterium]|nr:hypothetical protein FACS1894211_04780 [Clostridia bacterium]
MGVQLLFTVGLIAYAGGLEAALNLLQTDFAANIAAAVLIQCAMLAALLLWTRSRKLNPLSAVRAAPLKPLGIGYAVLMGLTALFGFMFVSFAADYLFSLIGYDAGMPEALSFDTAGKMIVGLLAAALLPAVVEECVFRGVLLRGLERAGKRRAVLLSAAAFALMHMNPAQTVHQFLLGIALAVAAVETGSLLAPMIMHFLNNALVVVWEYAGVDPSFGANSSQIFWLACVTFLAGTGIMIGITALYRKWNKAQLKGTGIGCRSSVSEESQPNKPCFKALLFEERNTVTFGLAASVAVVAVWIFVFVSGLFG